MTDRELLEMALKALEFYYDLHRQKPDLKVITALRTALSRKALDELAEIDRELGLDHMQTDLAQVGEVGVWGEPVIDKSSAKRIATQLGWQPKREWQGLTDEEMRHEGGQAFGIDIAFDGHLMRFARAIEAKLKEKNQ
jgi:hypothetical protein